VTPAGFFEEWLPENISLKMRGRFFLMLILSGMSLLWGGSSAAGAEATNRFGFWSDDEHGLPVFHYTMDQNHDPAAPYPTSRGMANEHWHLVGNDRVVALAMNQGNVVIYSGERGAKWYNYYQPRKKRLSGGYGFLKDGQTVLSTWYEHRPPGSEFQRVFGIGYYKKSLETSDLKIEQTVLAPFGDDPCLVSRVTIENLSDRGRDLEWFEFWDVNMLQFTMNEVSGESGRTGSFLQFLSKVMILLNRLAAKADHPTFLSRVAAKMLEGGASKNLNGFLLDTEHRGDAIVARIYHPSPPVAKNEIAKVDYYPEPMFLVSLDGPISGFETRRAVFFDRKGDPRLRTEGGLIEEARANQANACLVIKQSIRLEPRQAKTLTFLVGYGNATTLEALQAKYRRLDPVRESLAAWSQALPRVSILHDWLSREMRWNAYYLRALATYDEYFNASIISQSCSYQYVLGMNIAARDPLQHMLPMVYLHPPLAKEVLRYTLREMDERGFIPYGIKGVGRRTAGATPFPSDTNLYLMLAVTEYVQATRDFAFLEEELPFYPRDRGESGTVLEHLQRGWEHLVRDVGIGEHGLIKIRNSDWSDGFLMNLQAGEPGLDLALVEEKGESVLNTALAVYVLPYFAGMLERAGETGFAEQVRDQAGELREALLKQWNGRWFNRAGLGDGRMVGQEQIYLDLQPWAILGANLEPERERALTETLWTELSARSPIGAVNVWPVPEQLRSRSGVGEGAGVWYSLNAPLIWAYAKVNPPYAVEQFERLTFHRHAEAYPETWIGMWSGPDAYNGPTAKRPGETWDLFPYFGWMSDFPVMCSHAHACPWFALLKLAGIQPAADGYEINPRLGDGDFKIETELIHLYRQGNTLGGSLRPLGDGDVWFRVRSEGNQVEVGGRRVTFQREGEFIVFPVHAQAMESLDWKIE